jgi:flagellar M-ring protein FliF
MDFLNKTFAQAADLFRSMTLSARITSGLLLVVVVVSLVYLFRTQVSGPEVDLMHGLPVPSDRLPAMLAAFDKAGLSGHELRGTQILVPRGQQAKYMAALADAKALPPNFGSALRAALEAGTAFETGKSRDERMKVALQDELALFISQMHGIETAYVFIATDTKSGLSQQRVAKATAGVRPAGSAQLDESQVASIRQLVAGAIPGLNAENVTVSDLNGRTYHGSPEGGGSADDNLYLALTRDYEKDLKAKILHALCFVENVAVEATVVLDKERVIRSRKEHVDPKPTDVQKVEESSSRTHEGGGPAGRPGLQSQQPNAAATLATRSTGPREEQEESKSRTVSIPSRETTEKEGVGPTPERVAVSVAVPTSYFEKVWRDRNPTEEGQPPKNPDAAALSAVREEVSASIQKHVAAVLRPVVTAVTDPTELVTVTAFQDIKTPKLPDPPISRHALTWLGQYWTTLGMIGLAMFSLVMLRSMIRAAPAGSAAPTLPVLYAKETAEPEPSADQAQAAVAKRLRRFQGGGRSLRDELSELVKEDPDVAANILKSWIGHVG